MSDKKIPKTAYKTNLPHIVPIGATFFITFRLEDALPLSVVKELKEEYELKKNKIIKENPTNNYHALQIERKKLFGKYEYQLDKMSMGACWLKKPEIANILVDVLNEGNQQKYEIIAYCIMPNHVHLLLDLSIQVESKSLKIDELENYTPLYKIMKQIKGASARAINEKLDRKGSLWYKDSYDHYVRDDKEYNNIVDYIALNPVKAGLVKDWKDWEFTYIKNFELG